MVTCRDVNNLDLDGVELLTGEVGLDRVVSWTYFVQTKPYEEHMNPGNFALIVVDYLRFDIEKTFETMVELNALGIEYSCAMKSHFRKFGNQMSGSGNHLCNYASLLA